MSAVRALATYLDPGRPGFVRRIAPLLAGLGLAVSCGLGVFSWRLLRTPTGRYLTAVLWLQVDDYERVIETTRGLIDDFPQENLTYYKLLATGYRRSGQIEEQLATYDEAVRRLPDSWNAHSHRCWYGTLYGRAEEVMDSCNRAVELAPPGEGWGLVRRGAARAILGDREAAIEDIEEGLARWDRVAPGRDTIQPWREWLEVLKAGGNPFDEATLQYERQRF